MAKETKTVQCYPDDSIINKKIREYESFGWELISNQRCQEYSGQTFSSDGSSTKHYSTFNKLTFSRDKSAEWYSRVVTLENEYNSKMNSKPSCYAYKPSKGWLIYGVCGFLIGLCVMLIMLSWAGALIAIPCVIMGISLVLLIVYGVKNSNYKKDYDHYLSRKREWERTVEKEANTIREKAEAIVNGD